MSREGTNTNLIVIPGPAGKQKRGLKRYLADDANAPGNNISKSLFDSRMWKRLNDDMNVGGCDTSSLSVPYRQHWREAVAMWNQHSSINVAGGRTTPPICVLSDVAAGNHDLKVPRLLVMVDWLSSRSGGGSSIVLRLRDPTGTMTAYYTMPAVTAVTASSSTILNTASLDTPASSSSSSSSSRGSSNRTDFPDACDDSSASVSAVNAALSMYYLHLQHKQQLANQYILSRLSVGCAMYLQNVSIYVHKELPTGRWSRYLNLTNDNIAAIYSETGQEEKGDERSGLGHVSSSASSNSSNNNSNVDRQSSRNDSFNGMKSGRPVEAVKRPRLSSSNTGAGCCPGESEDYVPEEPPGFSTVLL